VHHSEIETAFANIAQLLGWFQFTESAIGTSLRDWRSKTGSTPPDGGTDKADRQTARFVAPGLAGFRSRAIHPIQVNA
jgi:hypothetical protein